MNTELPPQQEEQTGETVIISEAAGEKELEATSKLQLEEMAQNESDQQAMATLKQELLAQEQHSSEKVQEAEGTPFIAQAPSKKEGVALPRWLKKAFQVAGVASVGMLASSQAQAQQVGAEGSKTIARSGAERAASREHGKEISEPVKAAWDAYVHWLEQKGLKGSTELDKSNGTGTIRGIEMLEQYIHEHPTTALSVEAIKDIQDYFKEYREWVIARVLAKKGFLEEGVTLETLMERLSDKDGIPGSWTTSHLFPRDKTVGYNDAYMTMANNSNARKN